MSSARGINRERQVMQLLYDQGWSVWRMPGSMGAYDVGAVARESLPTAWELGCRVRLIEVKSTSAGPFHSFGPDKRDALRREARRAQAVAQLCWWPKQSVLRSRGLAGPQWIDESEWPS